MFQIRKYRTSLPFSCDFIKEFDSLEGAQAYLNRVRSDLLNTYPTDAIYLDSNLLEYTTDDQAEVVFYEIFEPCNCSSDR